jgi:hypothetical protein
MLQVILFIETCGFLYAGFADYSVGICHQHNEARATYHKGKDDRTMIASVHAYAIAFHPLWQSHAGFVLVFALHAISRYLIQARLILFTVEQHTFFFVLFLCTFSLYFFVSIC